MASPTTAATSTGVRWATGGSAKVRSPVIRSVSCTAARSMCTAAWWGSRSEDSWLLSSWLRPRITAKGLFISCAAPAAISPRRTRLSCCAASERARASASAVRARSSLTRRADPWASAAASA